MLVYPFMFKARYVHQAEKLLPIFHPINKMANHPSSINVQL